MTGNPPHPRDGSLRPRRQQRFEQRIAASTAAAAAKGKPPPTLSHARGTRHPNPTATANVTDPHSRLLHTRKGRMQGYNAQAVTTCEQIVVAAELTQDANDFQQLRPVLSATAATLAAAGIAERPDTLMADSGYWSIANLTEIPDAPELLIPPPKHGRHGKPRKDGKPSACKSDGLRAVMTAKLQGEDGKARYTKRKETIEPVFGQIKEVRGARRFLRRGPRAAPTTHSSSGGTPSDRQRHLSCSPEATESSHGRHSSARQPQQVPRPDRVSRRPPQPALCNKLLPVNARALLDWRREQKRNAG